MFVKKKSMLSEKEKIDVSRAAADFESGNFLLRQREPGYREFMRELANALETPENKRNERQKDLAECYRECTVPPVDVIKEMR